MRFLMLVIYLPLILSYPFINLLRYQYPIISKLSPVHLVQHNSIPTKILDIGCGNGQSTNEIYQLLKRSPIEVTGIDKDEFKILKANYKNPTLTFGIDDIRRSKLPSQEYDLLFVSNVFQEIASRDFKQVMNHMNRISKNDSSLIYLYHNQVNDQLQDNMNLFCKNFNILQTSSRAKDHFIIAKPKI